LWFGMGVDENLYHGGHRGALGDSTGEIFNLIFNFEFCTGECCIGECGLKAMYLGCTCVVNNLPTKQCLIFVCAA